MGNFDNRIDKKCCNLTSFKCIHLLSHICATIFAWFQNHKSSLQFHMHLIFRGWLMLADVYHKLNRHSKIMAILILHKMASEFYFWSRTQCGVWYEISWIPININITTIIIEIESGCNYGNCIHRGMHIVNSMTYSKASVE